MLVVAIRVEGICNALTHRTNDKERRYAPAPREAQMPPLSRVCHCNARDCLFSLARRGHRAGAGEVELGQSAQELSSTSSGFTTSATSHTVAAGQSVTITGTVKPSVHS